MIRRILRRGNLRALRMTLPGRPRRGQGADVKSPSASRAEVAFETRQDRDGRPFIGLVLTRDGKPAAGGKVFTFHVAPNLTPEEIEMLVQALNRCVTHLGMADAEDETEGA